MAINTNFGYDPYRDRYVMSEREHYEKRKYEDMQLQMMQEAQMRQIIPQYLQQEAQAHHQQAQQPQENKTLLLL